MTGLSWMQTVGWKGQKRDALEHQCCHSLHCDTQLQDQTLTYPLAAPSTSSSSALFSSGISPCKALVMGLVPAPPCWFCTPVVAVAGQDSPSWHPCCWQEAAKDQFPPSPAAAQWSGPSNRSGGWQEPKDAAGAGGDLLRGAGTLGCCWYPQCPY